MSLHLAVARCGFGSNPEDLRAARLDLIGIASDIGVVLHHVASGVAMEAPELEDISKRLRQHRAWLMAQATGLQRTLAALEAAGDEQQALARAAASLGGASRRVL